jgi:opacity protein-like surface antigen
MNRTAVAAAFPALLATQVAAQDFYFGGGLAYSTGNSEAIFPAGEAGLEAGMVSLMLGQRFAEGGGFWGWETSADLFSGTETEEVGTGGTCADDGATGPYLCQHDATLRLVGIYDVPLGQWTEVYGSFGVGRMQGDHAPFVDTVESASTYGYTAGIGLNRAIAYGLIGRGEVIYDAFSGDTQEDLESNYSGTTVRFGVLRRF